MPRSAKIASTGTRNLRADTFRPPDLILRTILNIPNPTSPVKGSNPLWLALFFAHLRAHPRRLQPRYPRVHRAALVVRARQVADADQKLSGDLATGEYKCPLEQLHPF